MLHILQDITQNIEIESLCSIHHPLSGKVTFEDEQRFQQLPENLQQRYLQLRLRTLLYDLYFSGVYQPGHETTEQGETESSSTPIANTTAWGINLEFYQALHDNNRGQGFFDPGWRIVGEAAGKKSEVLVLVCKDELTLHVERDRHFQLSERSAAIGNMVSIKMPRNRLESGWYIALGDAGIGELNVSLYLNLAAAGTASVMRQMTELLNGDRIPFRFKMLYDPQDYHARITAILQFTQPDYPSVRQTLKQTYIQEQTHFRSESPGFAKPLAPGVALAEDPASGQEEFGSHRCQLVAKGLMAAYLQGEHLPEARMEAILNEFEIEGVDLALSHLNPGKIDIYDEF